MALPERRRRARRQGLVVCAALAALALAAFSGTVRNGFVNYDDPEYVTANPRVRAGLSWSTAAWAFTATRAANWHPVTWLSHLADVTAFGLDPSGHHAVSLALHALNAAFLFLVLRGLTGALWPSALAAALFAVHPLRVESVAWAAERKDVLSALFWIATLGAYRRHLARPTPWSSVPVLAAFALGLMAKPMLVTLPLALLLLDFWPLGRLPAAGWRRLLLEKAPLLALAAVSSYTTYAVQTRGGAVAGAATMPLAGRIANAVHSCVVYLDLTFWPRGLAAFYPLAVREGRGLPAALAALLLLGISVFALRHLRRSPWWAVGWLWFLGTLVPVLGLVQVGLQARADRYTYLPSIGLSLACAWGARSALGHSRAARAALAPAVAAVLLALTLASRAQVGHWRDTVALFRHALAVAPASVLAHNNLGIALAERGEVAEAVRHFRAALALDPAHAQAHYNLGSALDLLGATAEAVAHYRLALAAKPDYADAHNNLGVDLAISGRLDEAIAEFRAAQRIDPGLAGLGANLERALAQRAAAARGR